MSGKIARLFLPTNVAVTLANPLDHMLVGGTPKQLLGLKSQAVIAAADHIGRGFGDIRPKGPMSMRYQSPKPPHCPSCAQIMQLARVTQRFGDLPDLYTFECRACGVAHIEAGCKVADLEPEKPATGVQTHELEKHRCRWPVDGNDAETFFCGADRVEGHSYCAQHCQMAYQPAGATRSRAEAETAFRHQARIRKAMAAAA